MSNNVTPFSDSGGVLVLLLTDLLVAFVSAARFLGSNCSEEFLLLVVGVSGDFAFPRPFVKAFGLSPLTGMGCGGRSGQG